MPRHQPISFIAIVLILTTLLIAPSPTVLSQGREQNKAQSEAGRKVPAFKGAGAVSRSVKELPPPPPPALNPGALTAMIGATYTPGTVYARLSPSQPRVPSRGVLSFGSVSDLDVGQGPWEDGHARFGGLGGCTSPGHLYISLNSAANKKYLIDCAISGANIVKVGWGDGSSSEVKSVNGHLVFLLETTTAGWQHFSIYVSDSGTGWLFYSCEITNLVSGS